MTRAAIWLFTLAACAHGAAAPATVAPPPAAPPAAPAPAIAAPTPVAPAPAEDPSKVLDAGMDAFQAGKLDDAEKLFQHAVELGATEDGWNGVAWSRAYRGDDRGALEAFERIPNHTDLDRAWVLFALGKLDDALAVDAKVTASATKAEVEAYLKGPMLRGGLLLTAGRFAEALAPLEEARKRIAEVGMGNDPYYRAVPAALYAWAAARAGRDAAPTVKALVALAAATPGDRVLGIFVPIAQGEMALGKHDGKAAEAALSKCPAEATCLQALAEAQDARGEHDAATATRAKIRTLYKMSPPGLYYWRLAAPH